MKNTLTVSGFFAVLVFVTAIFIYKGSLTTTESAPALTPWASIGGCGASSGSVSMDMQLKWIGRGVSGGLIDAEALYINAGVGDTAVQTPGAFDGHLRYRSNAVLLNLFYHPQGYDFKLGLPMIMKTSSTASTGPFGDISLDVTKKWGMQGNLRSALSFTLPTGRYDIYTSQTLRQPEMQLGSGTINAGLRLDYTLDKDWGLLAFGTSYSGGILGMRTKTWKYDQDLGMPVSAKKNLVTARYFTHNASGQMNGWGSINDVGTAQPDMVSWFADVGFKSESIVHGFSFSFSLPTCDPQMEDRNFTVTNWYNNDSTKSKYAPTINLAQLMADTSTDYTGNRPLVTAANAAGRWVIMQKTKMVRPAFPGLTVQYSLEKSDSYVPLLFGCAVRTDYNKGFHFAALGAGVGLKFRVY